MRHWGPLITAVVVVLGLAGFVVTNTVGGLVVAEEQAAPPATAPPSTPDTPDTPGTPSESPPPSSEPAEPPLAEEQVYTGTATESRGLAIAVAVKGTEAAAYLCDGSDIEAWLKGTVDGDTVSLQAANGSASLTATLLAGGGMEGDGETEGRPFTFALDPAQAPAGLYRGESGDATIGWIVLEDGSQVGVASSPDGLGPAPELDPEQGGVELGGQQVQAVPVAGDTEF